MEHNPLLFNLDELQAEDAANVDRLLNEATRKLIEHDEDINEINEIQPVARIAARQWALGGGVETGVLLAKLAVLNRARHATRGERGPPPPPHHLPPDNEVRQERKAQGQARRTNTAPHTKRQRTQGGNRKKTRKSRK